MNWQLSAPQLRELTPEDWDALVTQAVAEVRARATAPAWWEWRESALQAPEETTRMRPEVA